MMEQDDHKPWRNMTPGQKKRHLTGIVQEACERLEKQSGFAFVCRATKGKAWRVYFDFHYERHVLAGDSLSLYDIEGVNDPQDVVTYLFNRLAYEARTSFMALRKKGTI